MQWNHCFNDSHKQTCPDDKNTKKQAEPCIDVWLTTLQILIKLSALVQSLTYSPNIKERTRAPVCSVSHPSRLQYHTSLHFPKNIGTGLTPRGAHCTHILTTWTLAEQDIFFRSNPWNVFFTVQSFLIVNHMSAGDPLYWKSQGCVASGNHSVALILNLASDADLIHFLRRTLLRQR